MRFTSYKQLWTGRDFSACTFVNKLILLRFFYPNKLLEELGEKKKNRCVHTHIEIKIHKDIDRHKILCIKYNKINYTNYIMMQR